ncbi:hypothetical protein M7I_0001 [Glarea lozoyensis 74030]|uniref:Uncharacterized protein n=1 Tax=Glarea lozoyensis (strain ATCC 74030 / MF5533) TaxID=1104152 RepID=H0EC68_GLAL7|nr:hypothetical protein M7I_0001 [Glarea lozoyensis 74030]
MLRILRGRHIRVNSMVEPTLEELFDAFVSNKLVYCAACEVSDSKAMYDLSGCLSEKTL